MTSKEKFKLEYAPFYALFFAAYPLIVLYGNNIREVSAAVIWRPLLLTLFGVALLWGSLFLLFRDVYRAGQLTSVSVLLFFVYGHLYQALNETRFLNIPIGHPRYLLPFCGLLLSGVLWVIFKKQKNPAASAPTLNALSACMLVFPLWQITTFLLLSPIPSIQKPVEGGAVVGAPPDIYYFVLDSYGRNDLLQTMGYDNSDFTDELKNMGFYVAECSQSNYGLTAPSLGSSLNMNYADQIGMVAGAEYKNITILVHRNSARRFLKSRGYQVVSFENGYFPARWDDADYYYVSPADSGSRMTDFEWLYMNTSMARVVFDRLPFRKSKPIDPTEQTARIRTLYILEQMEKSVPSIRSPKFVFAHLIIPHPPYVFGPNGESVNLEQSANDGYIGQVRYINQRILSIARMILETSENQPVIIIQGDHGPPPELVSHADRMKILNAYYLPSGSGNLYNTITPVNTFRIVFNEYFGADYEILEDVSLFSDYTNSFDFELIPNECQP